MRGEIIILRRRTKMRISSFSLEYKKKKNKKNKKRKIKKGEKDVEEEEEKEDN